jgi:hypothetical protein
VALVVQGLPAVQADSVAVDLKAALREHSQAGLVADVLKAAPVDLADSDQNR